MFATYMEVNIIYPEGRHLTYCEFSSHFVYLANRKEWKPRQRGVSFGRLSFVPHGIGELFYLRLFLNA